MSALIETNGNKPTDVLQYQVFPRKWKQVSVGTCNKLQRCKNKVCLDSSVWFVIICSAYSWDHGELKWHILHGSIFDKCECSI